MTQDYIISFITDLSLRSELLLDNKQQSSVMDVKPHSH